VKRRAVKQNVKVREKYILMKLEVKIDTGMCMKGVEV
jgi:hypothetical protein